MKFTYEGMSREISKTEEEEKEETLTSAQTDEQQQEGIIKEFQIISIQLFFL